MMSRFRNGDYWRPLDAVYARLPDAGHPLTERFALDLFLYTSRRELADPPADMGAATWERALPTTRAFFRDRARRLMWGDLSVVPMHTPPGYGVWQAIGMTAELKCYDAPEPVLGHDWHG